MITTLTLNPCIDHTINIVGFKYGGSNRVKQTFRDVSGKGVNVSIVVHQLGGETRNLLFEYENSAVDASKALREMGMECRGVKVPGELRTNIKIFDEETTVMSECNANGNPVSPEATEKMMELIIDCLGDTKVLVANGSVPPGVPDDFYARAINEAKARGILTILDADNQLFREGVKAAPDLIKPNKAELEKYTGFAVKTRDEIYAAAKELLGLGVKYVCVSDGADGAYLFTKDGGWFAASAEIEVRGVQGAGDSMVAGFAMAMLDGASPAEMLERAVATANGSLTHEGTKLCKPEDLEKILPQIKAEKIF